MDFKISSSTSSNELTISSLEHEYITASISGNPSAAVRVCTFTDELGLLHFLLKIAACKKPWKNEIKWESLENQFSISATCSSLGEVIVLIKLSEPNLVPDYWSAMTSLTLDFGQLDAIAKNASIFFGQTNL